LRVQASGVRQAWKKDTRVGRRKKRNEEKEAGAFRKEGKRGITRGDNAKEAKQRKWLEKQTHAKNCHRSRIPGKRDLGATSSGKGGRGYIALKKKHALPSKGKGKLSKSEAKTQKTDRTGGDTSYSGRNRWEQKGDLSESENSSWFQLQNKINGKGENHRTPLRSFVSRETRDVQKQQKRGGPRRQKGRNKAPEGGEKPKALGKH